MLVIITLLTAIAFATFYPLTFWISCHDPLKSNFHRFHLGLPTVVAGVSAIGCKFIHPMVDAIWITLFIWSGTLLLITLIYWNKSHPNAGVLIIPCLLGIIGYGMLQVEWLGPHGVKFFSGLLGGAILAVCMYAMNLGHWYLNVHGLPLSHLRRAMVLFWILVAGRAVFDALQLSSGSVIHLGDPVPLFRFATGLDGFPVAIAVFFGTLFPLIALYFVKGTLDAKSTQSATGILYVILVAVFIGEIAYKYSLIKFGITL